MTLELKIPPVALMVVFGGAMWLTAHFTPSLAFPLPGRLVLCGLFVLAGACFGVSGVWTFRRAGTTTNPIDPDKASAVVTCGVYGRTRNPMYLSLLLVLAGWALFLANGSAFLFLPAFVAYMNRFQILPEERILSEKFGPEYVAYLGSVRRWI